jgi:hypothetical protein
MTDYQIIFERPAYTVPEWAKACGLGETTIREHQADSRLLFRYPNRRKPIVFVEDGVDWLRSLPTEPPAAS